MLLLPPLLLTPSTAPARTSNLRSPTAACGNPLGTLWAFCHKHVSTTVCTGHRGACKGRQTRRVGECRAVSAGLCVRHSHRRAGKRKRKRDRLLTRAIAARPPARARKARRGGARNTDASFKISAPHLIRPVANPLQAVAGYPPERRLHLVEVAKRTLPHQPPERIPAPHPSKNALARSRESGAGAGAGAARCAQPPANRRSVRKPQPWPHRTPPKAPAPIERRSVYPSRSVHQHASTPPTRAPAPRTRNHRRQAPTTTPPLPLCRRTESQVTAGSRRRRSMRWVRCARRRRLAPLRRPLRCPSSPAVAILPRPPPLAGRWPLIQAAAA